MIPRNQSVIIFSVILIIRLSSVLIIRTAFVPDEYWQSLEVAHHMTYGYGYLTWEWMAKIRSCIYPFLFHILYSIFPESFTTLIVLPKVFQAVWSSVGDFFIYKLSFKLFGPACGRWIVFSLLTSWFMFYCASRTISNMAETSLTACGLYFYPWSQFKLKCSSCNYLWFAGASVLMRPTAIVFWVPLFLYHLYRENFIYLFKRTVLIGSINLAVLLLCDRWFYGNWVFTPYKFYEFNWTHDAGSFYGEHPFLWYFYAGLPAVLGMQIIPFILGTTLKQSRPFLLQIIWIMLSFSVLKHKEFRFLLPILPLALMICGLALNEIQKGRLVVAGIRVHPCICTLLTCIIFITQIPMVFYMGLVHQRGTVQASLFLSKVVDSDSKVLFLMPCHSTPYYSYIHQNISMNFLTCLPNFNGDPGYLDQADLFFKNPKTYLNSEKLLKDNPSHLVMYDSLYNNISELLKRSYRLCFKAFHSHFPESRTGEYVHVYCKR